MAQSQLDDAAAAPDEDGSEYVFVDRDAFEAAIAEGRFLEWAEFHGHLYGTPAPDPGRGRGRALRDRGAGGGARCVAQRPDAVVILIMPPSAEALESRLRARGDDDAHVERRLASAPAEVARGRELAAFVVVNDDVERAAREILSILEGLAAPPRHPRKGLTPWPNAPRSSTRPSRSSSTRSGTRSSPWSRCRRCARARSTSTTTASARATARSIPPQVTSLSNKSLSLALEELAEGKLQFHRPTAEELEAEQAAAEAQAAEEAASDLDAFTDALRDA